MSDEQTWFGQPRGLTVLFLTNMWEQFSYYGMRALLVYYMTKQLLFAQGKASLIYGAYTACAYFTPIIGGVIADRFLGKRRAIIAALRCVGDDRARKWVVPAKPAQPDWRLIQTGRSATRLGLQCLLCGH